MPASPAVRLLRAVSRVGGGRVIAWAGFFMVYDLIGHTTPQCEFWVFKTKTDAEAKRTALVALCGEDLVKTNF